MERKQNRVGQSFRRPASQLASCGDLSCEFLVDPIPRPRLEPIRVHYRPERREVMFIDCQKPNSMAILKLAQKMLRERGIAVKDEILIKPDASKAMPNEMLEQLSSERGLLAIGVND